MKTRDILITVTRTLTGWHVYNDHQFGRITAFDPQARYEVVVGLPDSDTISIVRTQYELVEDNTVLDTADMTRCPCSRGGCWARNSAPRMRCAVRPRRACCPTCTDWTRSEPC